MVSFPLSLKEFRGISIASKTLEERGPVRNARIRARRDMDDPGNGLRFGFRAGNALQNNESEKRNGPIRFGQGLFNSAAPRAGMRQKVRDRSAAGQRVIFLL